MKKDFSSNETGRVLESILPQNYHIATYTILGCFKGVLVFVYFAILSLTLLSECVQLLTCKRVEFLMVSCMGKFSFVNCSRL